MWSLNIFCRIFYGMLKQNLFKVIEIYSVTQDVFIILVNVPRAHVKKKSILLLLYGVLNKCQLGQFDWQCYSSNLYLYLFLFTCSTSIGNRVQKSLAANVKFSSSYNSIMFCFMNFGVQLIVAQTLRSFKLFYIIFHYKMIFFVCGNIICSETYFT